MMERSFRVVTFLLRPVVDRLFGAPSGAKKPRPGRARCRPVLEPLEARNLLTGTWTPLSLPPQAHGTMMLLSDGRVVGELGYIDAYWAGLSPDASGSYVNGTWSNLAAMHDTRLYHPAQVLQDGRDFIAGGEYGTGVNAGEVYDPRADTWTPTPNGPLGDIGDVPSAMLPDGRVLVGNRFGPRTIIYDPASNTWSAGANRLRFSRSAEESWVLLPDHSVLTVDIVNPGRAQRYLPGENVWVDAGQMPASLTTGFEIGPGLRLPDGRVFYIGSNSRTALYTPPADPHGPGSWEAGPLIPGGLAAFDAPAALLPNGKVLMAVGPQSYNGPTVFFEFDPATYAFTRVNPPDYESSTHPPNVSSMLMLPTGQVLWTDGSTRVFVYTPDGAPDPSWKQTVAGITDNGDGSFLLTGTQLNGISEGAAYGDDAEMSSNYPLVRLTDPGGRVFYARTFNWSDTGVATGDALVSTSFTLPAGLDPGTYSLEVVANGIASDPVDFTAGPPPGARGAAAVALAAADKASLPPPGTGARPPAPGPVPAPDPLIRPGPDPSPPGSATDGTPGGTPRARAGRSPSPRRLDDGEIGPRLEMHLEVPG
jgi:hypothetical protein